jgi:hypothetical protein
VGISVCRQNHRVETRRNTPQNIINDGMRDFSGRGTLDLVDHRSCALKPTMQVALSDGSQNLFHLIRWHICPTGDYVALTHTQINSNDGSIAPTQMSVILIESIS